MAKKKPISSKGMENELRKLYDLIEGQNFESAEEMQAFLNQMVGQKIDDILPKGKPDKREESMDLVYDAYETTPEKGKKLVKKALDLDPDNPEAYHYLGLVEKDMNKSLALFEKAMTLAKNEIGEKEFEELKGHFWGFHETRPYMRAKASYAEALFLVGRIDESLQQFGEMIALNPNDNQGVRYQYAALLVQFGKWKEFEKLRKEYSDEGSALWLFTEALYLFKKEGNSAKAVKALTKANKANTHVIPYMVREKIISLDLPDHYSFGDENEGVIYLKYALEAWITTEGAILWLGDFYWKQKKAN